MCCLEKLFYTEAFEPGGVGQMVAHVTSDLEAAVSIHRYFPVIHVIKVVHGFRRKSYVSTGVKDKKTTDDMTLAVKKVLNSSTKTSFE